MAKEYLLAADKYVKAGQFEKARDQIEKARAADPSNPYIPAFEERIKHFEVQDKHKPVSPPPAVIPPSPSLSVSPPHIAPVATSVAPNVPPTSKLPPTPTIAPFQPPPAPVPVVAPAKPVPPPKPAPPSEPMISLTLTELPAPPPIPRPAPRQAPPAEHPLLTRQPDSSPVSQSDAAPHPPSYSRESDAVRRTQSVTYMSPEPTQPPPKAPADSGLNDQIADMRRQLQELTSALQHERKAREEVLKQQIETTVRQFRSALEKAWQFGAPKPKDVEDLLRLAHSLNLPPDVETSVTREVKLAMYGRAVKEVIAKRKILKSSSSTLEWLRKVYQISLNEYLEYESQFLMDLVSDQFRGTMLFVASDEKIRGDVVPRFKSSGFAVVLAPTPESALEKVDKLSPNVIICDAVFGEGSLSGVKFLHIIRSNPKFSFIPFLLLSDTEDGAQIPTTDLRPNEAVVVKPIDYDELNAAMNDKLNQLRHYISTL